MTTSRLPLLGALAVGALGQGSTGLVMLALLLLGLGWSFVNVSGSALFSETDLLSR